MSSSERKKFILGDISEFRYGKMPDKTVVSDVGVYPVFSGYKYNGYYPEYNCEEGKLIVVARGVGGTGDVKITREKCWLTNLAIEFRLDQSVADIPFLYFYFLKDTLRYLDSGSAQSQITIDDLKRITIEVPPLEDQKRIASILSALDEKTELNRQTNQTLEAVAQAIYKEWFVNFNFPGSTGEMQDSELGPIPKGWRIGRIGELSYVQNGYAFKSNIFSEIGECGVIKIKNISCNLVDVRNMQYVASDAVKGLDEKFKVNPESLLIAMTGAEVGKIGLVPFADKELWLNQRVGMFIEKISNSNCFLYVLLSANDYQSIIRNSALGSAQPNISASVIESIKAILPSDELIVKYGEIVRPLFDKLLQNVFEINALTQIRDTLLPKLMNGEIEV